MTSPNFDWMVQSPDPGAPASMIQSSFSTAQALPPAFLQVGTSWVRCGSIVSITLTPPADDADKGTPYRLTIITDHGGTYTTDIGDDAATAETFLRDLISRIVDSA